jgi:hypothetical protein
MSLVRYLLQLLLPSRRHRPDYGFEEPKRFGRNKHDTEDGGVPVDPNQPLGLSGGAAAALEFDDD